MKKLKRKVAIITREFPIYSNRGGIATFFLSLSKLLSQDHKVIVLTEGQTDSNTIKFNKNVEIVFNEIRFNSKLLNHLYFRSLFKFFRKFFQFFTPELYDKIEWSFFAAYWLKKTHRDVKIIHSCEYDFPFLFIKFFFPKVKLIIHSESPEYFLMKYEKRSKQKLMKAYLEIFFTIFLADYIVACSSHLKKFWEKLTNKPVTQLHNIIDTSFWDNTSFIKKDDKITSLIYIGRIEFRKGADLLIKSFLSLRKNHKSLRLYLIGNDNKTFKVGDSWLSVNEYLNLDYDSCDNLYLIKQINDKLKLKEFISKVKGKKIYVHLARYEPNSLSIIEAMAMGLPILTSEDAGRDLIIHDKNGYTTSIDDQKEIELKLEAMINDNDLCLKLGENAKRLAKKNLDYRRVAFEYKQIYNFLENK